MRKGEKGIAILAPIVSRTRVTDDETGDENVLVGLPRAFRITYVFDIEQTDGEELPAVPVSKLDGADPNSPSAHRLG